MLTPVTIDTQTLHRGSYEPRTFVPARSDIPAEFFQPGNPWAVAASNLMWFGSHAVLRAQPRAGIEMATALMHVGAVLHAVRLPVDYREAAAAYLLSSWFVRLELSNGAVIESEADTPGDMTCAAGALN